jgi:hypothetical protein
VKRASIGLFLTTCILISLEGQDHDFLPHFNGYHQIEKAITLHPDNAPLFFSQVKPYSRKKSIEALWQLDSGNTYAPIFMEGGEYLPLWTLPEGKGILKRFYKTEADFYHVDEPGFDLHVNPVWQACIGYDDQVSNTLFVNSRGLDIRGSIDKRVAFYTRLLENQAEYPYHVMHVADSIGLIPYEGFWKEYNTTTDYLRAFGYVDFGVSKHISAQLGYGRHFIGNGIRSMVLSDFSNSYPYLRINTEVWRVSYTNLFAELIADVFTYSQGTLGASEYPKKFLASHFLDIALTDNFHFGLFETIIFGQPDSVSTKRYRVEYLNPIIFYRAVEQQDGSGANALIGATFNWSLRKKVELYGQFVLDELIVSELTSGEGWWGNKFSYQLGGNLYDIGLHGLDLRIEHNYARPYTYAHEDYYTSYTHYKQPLAHPFGANFKEWIGELRYQPIQKLQFHFLALIASYGTNESGINYGQNPTISYLNIPNQYGNEVLQGNRSDLLFLQFRTSYEWRHNLFVDLTAISRSEQFEHSITDRSSQVINLGFRWNMPNRNYLF